MKAFLNIGLFFVVVLAFSSSSVECAISDMIAGLLMPTCSSKGIKYSTIKSQIPATLQWGQIGFAKELINLMEQIVVISGGSKPIPLTSWNDFSPTFPWQKNIDRNLLFNQTSFLRSPGADVNCNGANCIKERTYRGYTWVDIAKPICVTYLPGKTNVLKPAKGYVVIKTIQKCQVVLFSGFAFQLTDNKGNFYVMHAYETGLPSETATNSILPSGWTMKRINLSEPLIVQPFGGGNECFYNILGDSLGQGYHQYIYADKFYPNQ
jgi:hypothetical protein